MPREHQQFSAPGLAAGSNDDDMLLIGPDRLHERGFVSQVVGKKLVVNYLGPCLDHSCFSVTRKLLKSARRLWLRAVVL